MTDALSDWKPESGGRIVGEIARRVRRVEIDRSLADLDGVDVSRLASLTVGRDIERDGELVAIGETELGRDLGELGLVALGGTLAGRVVKEDVQPIAVLMDRVDVAIAR